MEHRFFEAIKLYWILFNEFLNKNEIFLSMLLIVGFRIRKSSTLINNNISFDTFYYIKLDATKIVHIISLYFWTTNYNFFEDIETSNMSWTIALLPN